MNRCKVDDNIFVELQPIPKGFSLNGPYIKKFINFYDDSTGRNDTLDFVVSEKLYDYLDRLGYIKKFFKNYCPWRVLHNVNFPYDPDETKPVLCLIIQISIS